MKRVKQIAFIFFGVTIAFVVVSGIAFAWFTNSYSDRVYPGVYLNKTPVGGYSDEDIRQLVSNKSKSLEKTSLTIQAEEQVATFSAEDIDIRYDKNLAAKQAYSFGRSGNRTTDLLFQIRSFSYNFIPGQKSKPLSHVDSILHYDTAKIDEALETFSYYTDVEPVEPQFQFNENTNRVTKFALGEKGKKLDITQSKKLIASEIEKNIGKHTTVSLPVEVLLPETGDEDVDNLGIVEKIATGESYYRGSIAGRVHNVALAASRVSGILVGPGEVFSFNDAIGDISSGSGYREAYIIQDGKTILDDGGGVCQVSTTVFRAALNAGLEIVERYPHSYRVSYYEQGGYKPGLDATIFVPSVDLKIRNNTENHILIQSKNDPQNAKLTYEIYGKNDGRTVDISDISILSQSPPLPPVYQEDPTLAQNEIKQVDWPASGAKTSFDYTVKKDGEVLGAKTFVSNFRPWQAVYLYGPGTEVPESN